jgi:hypothetical protein
MVLALIAVLAVAGPGLVLAGSPGTSYPKPLYADIIGVFPVCNGGTTQLQLKVKYSDGTESIATSGVTWKAKLGTVDGSGMYTAPATGTKDLISASYSNGVGSGTANRVITLQDCSI